MLQYVYRFAHTVQFTYSCNKNKLIMPYYLCKPLLYSIFNEFIKNICFYNQQWCWWIVLSFLMSVSSLVTRVVLSSWSNFKSVSFLSVVWHHFWSTSISLYFHVWHNLTENSFIFLGFSSFGPTTASICVCLKIVWIFIPFKFNFGKAYVVRNFSTYTFPT